LIWARERFPINPQVRIDGANSLMSEYSLLIRATAKLGRIAGLVPKTYQPFSRSTDQNCVDGITPRELEILSCLAQGMSDKQIAYRCNIRLGTVKTHVRNILQKAGAANRTQAVTHALSLGLIDQPVIDSQPKGTPSEERMPRDQAFVVTYAGWGLGRQ
jgi:DNA-binding CsgD family transcriptional regulator